MQKKETTYLIKIPTKKFYKESEKAYSFLTTVYRGRFFVIPKSQIIYKDVDEEFWRVKITSFIFNKIKEDLIQADAKITEI